MKILHINCNYILSALHQCLIDKLNDAGFKNDVFVATYDKGRSIVETKSYVKVEECFNKWDRISFYYKQAKIIRRLEECYQISDFDCIHAYTLFTDGNTALKMSKKYKLPYVVAVRNTDVNDFFAKRVNLRRRGIEIMENASKVFFLSEAYRKQVFEKYVPKNKRDELLRKTMIVPNGIDDFWAKNKPGILDNKLEGTLRLIYAGRIDKNKNIPTTQKAMELLKREGINSKLTVIGKIEDKKEFEKIISNKDTEYVNPVQKEKLIEYYRNSDIFVMPSYTESFGLVYAEAMSQGLPVVYTAGQGFDGQFEEGIVGYHVDANDESNIADVIKRILSEYDRLHLNVVEAAMRFNWREISKVYCKIYDSL